MLVHCLETKNYLNFFLQKETIKFKSMVKAAKNFFNVSLIFFKI
tara:strand:- start:873 stop:1004 length:132 start_codon:yes stop_codon:yes gene_type:complete